MAATLSQPAAASRARRAPHVAVLDSNPAILDYIRRILADSCQLSLFSQPSELIACVGRQPAPDLVLMDWLTAENNTGVHSLGMLKRILDSSPSLPVVMLSCSADLKEVVQATRMGAADIILKPFTTSDIESAIQHLITADQPSEEAFHETPLDENNSFVRSSKRMLEIEHQCTLVARTEIPVLILGESGTGKEIAAMFIHKMSARSQRSFLKVNCAAMPLDLLESELFGYEQGAFTGAVKAKPGKFEICNYGTIFLDEIGEMAPPLQAKLLQVLQDGTFSRLGSRNTVRVDVRVIAATNINIKAAIAQKTFREDLYYRLNGFSVCMPPLRERRVEIPILTNYFMRRISAKFERKPLPVSSALMQALCGYSWPGNLRELENTIKRYVVLADEQAIIEELNPGRGSDEFRPSSDGEANLGGLKRLVRGLKDDAESAVIAQTLEGTGWNRKAAAIDLKISYKALLYKIKQYNLCQPKRA
jgi:two-component system, NtrC family, response regulator AtoC